MEQEELQYLIFDNVEFDYDSVFQNEQTKLLFIHFLDEIYVSEQNHFYQKAQKLLKEADATIFFQLAHDIMGRYLRPEAKEAINVSKEEVKKVEQLLNQPLNPQTQQYLIDSITTICNQVLLTWKYDVFPRFVRSKSLKTWFHNLVRKQKAEASNILRQVSVLRSVKNKKKPDVFFNEEEFYGEPRCISEKDITFCEMLMEDSPHWKLLYADKSGSSIFKSEKSFMKNMPTLKKYSLTKFVCYFPFDIGTTVATLFADLKNGDPNVTSYTQLKYLQPSNGDEFYSTVVENTIELGAIFKKRCILDSLCGYYSPLYNGYGMVFRTFDINTSTNSDSVLIHGMGCHFLQRIDSSKTKYIGTLMLNLGGYAQKIVALSNNIYIQRCKLIQKRIISACEKHCTLSDSSKANATWYNQDVFGCINTLEDNCKLKLSKELYPEFLNTDTVEFYPDRRKITS